MPHGPHNAGAYTNLAPAHAQANIDTMTKRQPKPVQVPVPSPLEETSLTGQLLIAMPAMDNPTFAHSVILLCAHTSEGAMGIVLNQPLAKPSFDLLLEQLDVKPVPPARQIQLCQGGPVDHGRGFVLHTSDWVSDGSLRVDDRLALTASLDVLQEIAKGGGPKKGLLALGYSSWGPGQLDREMQDNVWLSAPAMIDLLFDADHETKWRRAMAILRVDPLALSQVAGRA